MRNRIKRKGILLLKKDNEEKEIEKEQRNKNIIGPEWTPKDF